MTLPTLAELHAGNRTDQDLLRQVLPSAWRFRQDRHGLDPELAVDMFRTTAGPGGFTMWGEHAARPRGRLTLYRGEPMRPVLDHPIPTLPNTSPAPAKNQAPEPPSGPLASPRSACSRTSPTRTNSSSTSPAPKSSSSPPHTRPSTPDHEVARMAPPTPPGRSPTLGLSLLRGPDPALAAARAHRQPDAHHAGSSRGHRWGNLEQSCACRLQP